LSQDQKDKIESEFIGILLSAMKKGMSPEEFFALADATMEHMRGKTPNEIIEKIMNDTASSDEVRRMVDELGKK